MDPAKARQHRFSPVLQDYSTRDAIIYALGIGAETPKDQRYLYENHEDFQVFPTFVVKPGLTSMSLDGVPGVTYNLQNILHGEQYIEFFEPIPEDGKFRNEQRIIDILDKGSAAVVLTEVTTYEENSKKKLSVQQFATFQLKAGGFGGNRSNPEEKPAVPIPKSSPDAVVEEKTSPNQAALYRMGSGDLNPLHIDPDFARASGFAQPILHGLCSLGVSTKLVLQKFADNDGKRLKAVKARFSKPVIPGQTLQVEMWRNGDRIHFQTKVKETGQVVISNAYVDLKASSSSAAASQSGSSSSLKSDAIFEQMAKELPKQGNVVQKVQAIITYDITNGGKHAEFYTLDLKNGNGKIFKGESKDKPTVLVTIDDEDFAQLVSGELSGMKAFMSGKLKAKGNVMILQKLQSILSGATPAKL